MNRRYFRLVAVFVLVFVLALVSAGASQAETDATDLLVASEDVYIDATGADTNFNNGGLFLNYGTQPGQIVFLKFNLTGIGYTIDKARLNMDTVNDGAGCGLTSDAVAEINIYQMPDTWSEGTVTWNSAPARGSFLDDMEQSPLVPGDHVYWEDQGAEALAAYLEAERNGDGFASIWMELPGAFGNQVILEDSEGTVASVGCAGVDLAPSMQISQAADPLAVTNLEPSAANSGINPVVWLALAAVVIVISGLALVSRKQTEIS